jgi:hypothetical protein
MSLTLRRPATATNPSSHSWRIDGFRVDGHAYDLYVLDTARDPDWSAKPRRFVPYLGEPYPDGTGLNPQRTLNAAIQAARDALSARATPAR